MRMMKQHDITRSCNNINYCLSKMNKFVLRTKKEFEIEMMTDYQILANTYHFIWNKVSMRSIGYSPITSAARQNICQIFYYVFMDLGMTILTPVIIDTHYNLSNISRLGRWQQVLNENFGRRSMDGWRRR